MKAVLGILLIFGGLFLAYMILSGKFPVAGETTTPEQSKQGETVLTPGPTTGAGSGSGGTKTVIPVTSTLGLPTVTALASAGDQTASAGGFIGV